MFCAMQQNKEVNTMVTMIREILSMFNIMGLAGSGTTNLDLMGYFRSEYKNNARAAYDYFKSTGQFDFKN